MPSPRLDRIDMNILAELQRNGRMTNAQLADAVGLSPSPCLLRVKRLQSSGIITGYGAQIDLRKLGPSITIFLEVTLTQHRSANFQRFEAGLRRRPEVVECHLISGGFDYLVKLVVRELSHYQDMMETLQEENIGIAKYFSYVVVKSPIEHGEVPLKLLFEDEGE
ncbi:Lrp/AsnC family transcriptional regulator [Pseudooceanicola nanhaiensis]|uniref:Lrp/AsnC family transcriptional regulator n=1 Tax=Pseudooceanicola nanhaiensis TaxID=375761 RepID=UPI001CD6E232|nr:Lrp/AsnC family transcriptional regulator [Pseudooceanicola nanhaiensis]MCA0920820.1 Lrp/AsnC family transcriptional regulator [Pseudooceanicola nanhaiensis]